MEDSVVVKLEQVITARRYNCRYQGICPRLGLRLRTLSRISRMKQDLQLGTGRSLVLGTKVYQEGKENVLGGRDASWALSSIIRMTHQGRE